MSEKHDIEAVICKLAEKHAPRAAPISPSSKIVDDLQLENDYVYLLIDINRHYGVKIPDFEFKEVRTIEDLADVYCNYLRLKT